MAALVNLFDSCPCKPFLMAALVKPFMIDTFSNSFYLCRSLFNFYLLKNKNYEKIEFQKAKKKKKKKSEIAMSLIHFLKNYWQKCLYEQISRRLTAKSIAFFLEYSWVC